jgi:hypothetical protein
VRKIPSPLYELVVLQGNHIDGQFYAEELTSVIVTKHTVYPSIKYCARESETAISSILFAGTIYFGFRFGGEPTHFYVTLLSNSSQELYPSNTISSFTVHLAQPIDMGSTDRWEVMSPY